MKRYLSGSFVLKIMFQGLQINKLNLSKSYSSKVENYFFILNFDKVGDVKYLSTDFLRETREAMNHTLYFIRTSFK